MFVFRNAMIALLMVGTGAAYASSTCVHEEKSDDKKPKTDCCVIPECNHRFWVSAEIIGWSACDDGIDCNFGSPVISALSSGGVTTTTIVENDKGVNLGWHLGYRISVGFQTHECLESVIFLTSFAGKKKVTEDSNTFNWNLNLNTVEALLTGNFAASKCALLRPFTGLRAAMINQKIAIDTTNTVTTNIGTSTVVASNRDSQKFSGVGPEVGIQGDWFLGCGLDLFAVLDGAVMFGKLKTQFNDVSSSAIAIRNCTATATANACQNVADLYLGIRWRTSCFIVSAAFENHAYFSYNQLGCGGNLDIYGLTIGGTYVY